MALAIAGVYLGYLAAGTGALAVGWAARILLLSVVAGWAVARQRPDDRA